MHYRWLSVVAVCVWFALCVTGLCWVWHYQSAPGATIKVPTVWPADSAISRNGQDATLVMFVHPKCPCTRASMAELERLVAQSGSAVRPRIVFFKPAKIGDSKTESDWEKTDLWNTAQRIPGATVVVDNQGDEARRFHATISGQTLVYDAAGRLQFSGGITSARGHEGDNPGRSAISTLISSGAVDYHSTPVFGCPISALPNPK